MNIIPIKKELEADKITVSEINDKVLQFELKPDSNGLIKGFQVDFTGIEESLESYWPKIQEQKPDHEQFFPITQRETSHACRFGERESKSAGASF